MKIAIAGTNCLAYWLGRCLSSHMSHQFIILSRSPKPVWSENGWQILVVNYNNEADLVLKLTGCDLVLSMVTQGNLQLLLIDAALKAHVSRFVPCEFAGQPSKRPEVLDRGHRAALNRLGQHVEEGMYHSFFVCGLFYDTFGPDGLRGSNIGFVSTAGNNGEGSFLVDVRARRAEIPLDAIGRPAQVCMTSILDAARFIVALIVRRPLHLWPRELRMQGERFDVLSIVRAAEHLRGGQFERLEYTRDALQTSLQLAQAEGDAVEALKINRMIAVSAGAYDYTSANLNDLVDVAPYRFDKWLHEVWSNAL